MLFFDYVLSTKNNSISPKFCIPTFYLSNPNENQSFPQNEIAQFEKVHNDILEKVVVTTDRFLFFDSVVVVWLVVCIPDRKI